MGARRMDGCFSMETPVLTDAAAPRTLIPARGPGKRAQRIADNRGGSVGEARG